jgi:hypothetical protein
MDVDERGRVWVNEGVNLPLELPKMGRPAAGGRSRIITLEYVADGSVKEDCFLSGSEHQRSSGHLRPG